MKNAIRLKAPDGCTEVSHGGETFPVDETGHVEVPGDSVEMLKGFHGFKAAQVVQQTEESPAGATNAQAPVATPTPPVFTPAWATPKG